MGFGVSVCVCGGVGGAGVSEIFDHESKFKIKTLFFFGGGEGGGGREGARVSEFFFTKNPNLTNLKKKKRKKIWGVGGRGGGAEGGGRGGEMFQLALPLLEDNNCAKLFLKSMHKCTSYGAGKLNT